MTMSSSDNVRRNYEVASLHAKLQAKTYENEMLKRLARHLVSMSSGEEVGSSQQVYSYDPYPPAPSTKSTKEWDWFIYSLFPINASLFI